MSVTRHSWCRRWRWPLAVLVLLAVTELVLRLGYGFCDAVLMRADARYEYIAQPSQDRWRFGHRIRYNSLSMRSDEPDSSAFIILGCGDSVINGGSLMDNDSLATSLLGPMLTRSLGRRVQVLNISAGSWGPDNCAAYLAHTALPTPSALVLVTSSHDAHDNMSFKRVVGVRKHFPAQQYPIAILELIDRYLLPRYFKTVASPEEELGIDKGDEEFNTGFKALEQYAKDLGIPFLIYLHAERSEIRAGAYNHQGQEIIRYATRDSIPLVRALDHGASVDQLRDNIHLNEAGQRRMAEVLGSSLTALMGR